MTPTATITDFKVADLSLADFGRKEITLAEHEMPGLMAIRARVRRAQPLKGARITGSLHMTIQTAVLIETLTALGARGALVQLQHLLHPGPRRRGGRGRPDGTPEEPRGVPVFAWKGETLEEYWWCTVQALRWPARTDRRAEHDPRRRRRRDAARAQGRRVRGARAPCPTRRARTPRSSGDPLAADALAGRGPPALDAHRRGHPGRHRGDHDRRAPPLRDGEAGELLFPAINVNDSVTKSKFDNLYGCRHSLIDGINRATDVMIGGKVAVICGFGDVGKGCAESLRGQGARVVVTEIDPICALQAAMQGYEVRTLEKSSAKPTSSSPPPATRTSSRPRTWRA